VEIDLRWLCYIVSPPPPQYLVRQPLTRTSNEYDQELDSVLVGPLPVGVNKFLFRADPPDLSRIPNSEIIGVTVILLSCSYEDREFVRVGYYVNNEYVDEALSLEPPAKPVIEKVQRQILAEKPRVTRFAIKWFVCLLAVRIMRMTN
jgi:histone chaperone ASF1